MTTQVQAKFDVGGVLLDRPFKVRRLGHFGFNVRAMKASLRFYRDLLGFKVSDLSGFAARVPNAQELVGPDEDPGGYFMRYNGDHHAFVLFNRTIMDAMRGGKGADSEVDINQITWQVGSLGEVVHAAEWLQDTGVHITRTGRDMPGSNWHTYFLDPDGHTNELYYGMEQVGWEGYSKPKPMYERRFTEKPSLPQVNEFHEVQNARAAGVDVTSGYRDTAEAEAAYDVDGVLMARPFKIVRIGPIGLFVDDLAESQHFYERTLGFVTSEATTVNGYRGAFLRANTEHHSFALFEKGLRAKLPVSQHSTSAYLGLQLGSYRQLKDAISFLRANDVRVDDDLPAELHPGSDYAAMAYDPEGRGLLLYYYMEQVGWDGQVRPQHLRRAVTLGVWPDTLEAVSDTYGGEPFLGPWA